VTLPIVPEEPNGRDRSSPPRNYSTILPRLQRLRSLTSYLVVTNRGDYVCNQNDVRGYDCGYGCKSRVAYECKQVRREARGGRGPRHEDTPFHMYFSDAKYDVIGTIPRERLKMTSLKSTPVLRMERLIGWENSHERDGFLTLVQLSVYMPVQKHPARSFFARYVLWV
jgi:hypothetical protein